MTRFIVASSQACIGWRDRGGGRAVGKYAKL